MKQRALSRSTWMPWLFLISGAVVFGLMAVMQARGAFALDQVVQQAVASWQTPVLTTFFKGITFLGDPRWFVALCLVLLVLARPWSRGIVFVVNALMTGGLNHLLKCLFARPRPDMAQQLVAAAGYSFPSGHSMGAMAIYGLLIYAVWCSGWPVRRKRMVMAALTLLILLIGLSRIYLRVHYPSDVLGGFAASLVYLTLFVVAVRKLEQKRQSTNI